MDTPGPDMSRIPKGADGVRGFLGSIFTIHYGLATWTGGIPFMIGLVGAVSKVAKEGRGGNEDTMALVCMGMLLLLLPYTPFFRPWPAWHRFVMEKLPTTPGISNSSFTCDTTRPIDFHRGPVLLCYHPHGVFCGAFSGSHGVLHPGLAKQGVNFCLASALYHMPLFRFFVVGLFGNIRDAGKDSMQSCMEKEQHLALLPGGFEEASITTPGRETVYVQKRTGFIKLALQYGYTLHPVYSFGENELFHNFVPESLPFSWRFAVNRFKIPIVLPWGRWWCPLMPKQNACLHTVVGRPIPCPRIRAEDITKKLVLEYQKKYVAELLRLFDEHKGKVGGQFQHKELEIF